MPEKSAAISREFLDQQRKRLEALRQELLGGERKAEADERAAQVVRRRRNARFRRAERGPRARNISGAARSRQATAERYRTRDPEDHGGHLRPLRFERRTDTGGEAQSHARGGSDRARRRAAGKGES